MKGNKKDTPISTRIPLTTTYNQFLPNMSKIIRKNWNILSVSESLKKNLQNEPVKTFKHNKNLKELIHRQQQNRKQHCKENKQKCF